ncbi:MAG: hypothetical protein M3Y67_03325, partial [Pseudomonadota bacterium]|nr:hypothetical protein [Pseudomonadota bacterium]
SMVVDPWGEVVDVRAEGEGVVLAELDPARIASVRRQLPALEHRIARHQVGSVSARPDQAVSTSAPSVT